MFKIIQSHRTENLVDQLLEDYQSDQQGVFEPFVVIVPSMVLGDWLDKTIASRAGISTLVMTKFWGQYQWTLMQDVLNRHNEFLLSNDPNAITLNVPEVAVLSPTVMQWRIFGYLTYYLSTILSDDNHPLNPIVDALIEKKEESLDSSENTSNNNDDTQTDIKDSVNTGTDKAQQDSRLWQLASDLARVFNRYLTHREDWLQQWSNNKKLNVELMIAEKDALSLRFDQYARGTPNWLVDHYIELEKAQRFLWFNLFSDVHQYRVKLEEQFWEALKSNKAGEKDQLPNELRIFTIQQLPQTELDFLQQLSRYLDITLLHYNPSKLFWADIVDKSWLQRQQIINPESVYLRDYGHSLLSRLGKQSRDTFAMLANLSGNEQYKDSVVDWHDNFEDDFYENYQNYDNDENHSQQQPSLLRRLQNDVLMLDEQGTQQAAAVTVIRALTSHIDSSDTDDLSPDTNWYDDDILQNKRFVKQRQWTLGLDNSLSIHSCHSLQRQLEVLRIMIGRWLNEPLKAGEKKRHLSDIVVLLPDVERHHALIGSIFVNGKGQDGLVLPAKVTGVVDASIRHLWEAITGFYKLLGSDSARFEADEVLDWLMLPPLYENFGLTQEQMSRGCDLLIEAGFIRGFDEQHLQQTLDSLDFDYRFTFARALDRLTLGLLMPQAEITDCLYPLTADEWPNTHLQEKSLPLPQISLNDAPIIEALCLIFKGLEERRSDYTQKLTAEKWLEQIEKQVIHRYFEDVDQTRSMRVIYNAMNGFKSSLRANRHYQQYSTADSTSNTKSKSKEVERKLASVEKLTLKLNFMLDSIEDELESQQVSAEPTGVITFGRFGALRNVPFDLVVMLNMNLSEFPNRDRDNRYDLMKATNARRGDRDSEDDDNGAFLDALLCARSACWIFYNGQSLTDTHEHLPANPVSELLQFLQGEVQWQVTSLKDLPEGIDPTTENLKRYLPRLVKQWLVTEHPALPFHHSLFQYDADQGSYDSKDTIDPQANEDPNFSSDTVSKSTDLEVDDLDLALEKAMFQSKLDQIRQFPPAPLWQAVFQTLNTYQFEAPDALVSLATQQQFQVMAQVLGHQMGQLGQLDDPTLQQLVSILNLEDVAQLRHTLFDIEEIDIDANLTYKVRHPAKTYLRNQKLYVLEGEQQLAAQEPLFLDHLTAYKIKEHLINDRVTAESIDSNEQVMAYQNILPAGVARQTTLPNQLHQLELQCSDFKLQLLSHFAEHDLQLETELANDQNILSVLSPTVEIPVRIELASLLHHDADTQSNAATWLQQLPKQIKLKGMVPLQMQTSQDPVKYNASLSYADQSPKQWLNLLPNSASPRNLLKFWLAHLYWQVARRTSTEQVALNDGMSIWRFNKTSSKLEAYKKYTTFKLKPICYEQAVIELIKWAIFSNLAGLMPVTLLPDYALKYVHKVDAADEQSNYIATRADFSEWLSPTYGIDTIYDTCSKHPIWQYLLRDQDAFKALSASLQTLSLPLYQPMYDSLQGLE